MAKKSYTELLLDPRWQRRRLEILQRSNFTCERCKATDKTLHVHHKIYRKGAMPWEYLGSELEALCKDCHLTETQLRAALDEALAKVEPPVFEEILGYAEAAALQCAGEGQLMIRSWAHAYGVVRSYDITDYEAAQKVFNASCITHQRLRELSQVEQLDDVGLTQ